ncbi:AAA family ATPase [Pelagibius sp. 7325]|uniref:bifunctional aminoglycoside phosphotransferase/ATP-binding protein n=1 Tax=Pelagibius sp. 7325 TaxID=3131994 RepID=UPI0030EC1D05
MSSKPTEPVSGHNDDTQNQAAVLALLADPATYGAGVDDVQRIDTHGAIVFLAGDRAYKVKRAVAYPYMDFSTLERRRVLCLREQEINSRTAPDLYLDVVPVTKTASGLALGGEGKAVEWVLVMRRFDQDQLLSRRAAAGQLTAQTMTALADAVARFHDAAEPRQDIAAGAKAMRWVISENGEEFAERADLFDPDAVRRVTEAALAQLDRHAALLDARAADGKVRLCHGDLHLRNVVLLDGKPTLFDAIEFNDAIACIDVIYDLAFLLMDLEHRDLRPFANLVLNRYLQRRDEAEALALLPLFLSARAAVRAKVAASLEAVAGNDGDENKVARRTEAAAYFELAGRYLDPPPPRLVAVGGLSGTGKTTLARALAPDFGAAPGALHLRSDVLRKQLAGVDELEHLPPEAYSAEASADVYAALVARACQALAAGHAVILDAVFARPEERETVEAVARAAGVEFTGLWLQAPPAVLKSRVSARSGDASDATAAVVEQQLTYDLGVVSWHPIAAGQRVAKLRDEAGEIIKNSP